MPNVTATQYLSHTHTHNGTYSVYNSPMMAIVMVHNATNAI